MQMIQHEIPWEQRYKALGGSIQVIVKRGVGHVHGLDDPMPIIESLVAHRPPASGDNRHTSTVGYLVLLDRRS
jgi:hypothetical protein